MHVPTRIVGAAVETWRAPVTHSRIRAVANFRATPREIHSNDRGRNHRFRDLCSRPRKGAELWERSVLPVFVLVATRFGRAPAGSQTKVIAFDICAMSGVIAAVTIGTARSKLLNTVLSGSDDTALVARDLFFSPCAPTVLDLRACTLTEPAAVGYLFRAHSQNFRARTRQGRPAK